MISSKNFNIFILNSFVKKLNFYFKHRVFQWYWNFLYFMLLNYIIVKVENRFCSLNNDGIISKLNRRLNYVVSILLNRIFYISTRWLLKKKTGLRLRFSLKGTRSHNSSFVKLESNFLINSFLSVISGTTFRFFIILRIQTETQMRRTSIAHP